MKNLLKLIAFIILILANSCVSEWDRMLEENNIDIEFIDNESKKNTEIKIVEYKNNLTISLKYTLPNNFEFPSDSIYGIKLSETQFYLKLKCNNKHIITDQNLYNNKGYNWSKLDTNYFIIPFKKQNIKNIYSDEIEIPMTYFHSLKQGKQNIEAELFIDAFYGAYYDSVSNITYNQKITYSKINNKLKFTLDVPEIYNTVLYSYGIELRNDEGFTPTGMDFSFRLGYPDIYWEIYYPAKNEKDFKSSYWRSQEATYSTSYNYFDTIYLFHFSPKDKLKIGVYDRDDLSRDDFLGDWYGAINELESDSFQTLKFDFIEWFKIKAIQKGCINKY